MKQSMYSHFVPGAAKAWGEHNRMERLFDRLMTEGHFSGEMNGQLRNASKTVRNHRLTSCFARIVLAEAIYEASARTYAFGSRDWRLEGSQAAQAKDTSITAGAVAAYISTIIPDSWAGAMRWIEIGVSGTRAAFEQWYFRKIGLVADPAAILLNPVNQFALETVTKIASEQPTETGAQKYVYTLGIVGNVIRVAINDLLILGLIGKKVCGIDYRTMTMKRSTKYKEAVDLLTNAIEVDDTVEKYLGFDDY